VRTAEIWRPRDHHTRVANRSLKRYEMDAWITGRVMCEGRQRVPIRLRDVLSRDSATWTAGNTVSRALDYRIGHEDHFARIDVRLLSASEARAAASLNRLAATVQEGRSGRSQPLGKPCVGATGNIGNNRY
jgi:hypothetical protein